MKLEYEKRRFEEEKQKFDEDRKKIEDEAKLKMEAATMLVAALEAKVQSKIENDNKQSAADIKPKITEEVKPKKVRVKKTIKTEDKKE